MEVRVKIFTQAFYFGNPCSFQHSQKLFEDHLHSFEELVAACSGCQSSLKIIYYIKQFSHDFLVCERINVAFFLFCAALEILKVRHEPHVFHIQGFFFRILFRCLAIFLIFALCLFFLFVF